MITPYFELFLKGIYITTVIWISAACISMLLGSCIGSLISRALYKPYLSPFLRAYVTIIKGIPAYVQLLIAYFVIPSLLRINPSPLIVSIITLGICSSAYVAEIVRGGINAVAKGQWEAARVLGYSKSEALRRIIIPQALTISLPSIIAEFEQLLKSTALAATIGVLELTRVGMNIVSRELNPLPIYLSIACIYLLFSIVINSAAAYYEKRKTV